MVSIFAHQSALLLKSESTEFHRILFLYSVILGFNSCISEKIMAIKEDFKRKNRIENIKMTDQAVVSLR